MDDRLTENSIPGSSFSGRRTSELKNDELRFWLKCRNNSARENNVRCVARHVKKFLVKRIK